MMVRSVARRALSRTLLTAVLSTALAGCQGLVFGTLNTGRTSPSPIIAAVYDDAHGLALDIHRPAPTKAPAAVVVFLYGGSWRGGARGDYAFVGRALADSGVLAIIADYRRYPRGRFPDFAFDAARAVKWAREHAGDHGGDPSRVFIAGHSAGAHIAALVASDRRYLASVGLHPRDLAGAIGIAGPYDFLPITDPKLAEVFGPAEQWPASQPVNFIDGDEPPFLLLHGNADRVVERRNSESLAGRLQAAGVPVTLTRYDGIGHFRILAAVRYPRLGTTLGDIIAYVARTPSAQALDAAVTAPSPPDAASDRNRQ